MASWEKIAAEEPAFAQMVERRFDKYRHKVMATLRKDGSPRVSGIEAEFRDGDLWIGAMPRSLKALDLMRDPRVALHSGTEDPEDAPPAGAVFDAKIAGRAVEVSDPEAHGEGGSEQGAHRFRIDIHEIVLVTLGDPGDHLLLRIWTEDRGLIDRKRY